MREESDKFTKTARYLKRRAVERFERRAQTHLLLLLCIIILLALSDKLGIIDAIAQALVGVP